MKTTIAFSKNSDLHNILFDEFFSEHSRIEVVAFNFDGSGAALCQCDGELMEIKATNLRKIIFGADKKNLNDYLTAIFDPETECADLCRTGGDPVFRLAELREMKKYDVANLAKKTLQQIQELPNEAFRYFSKTF